MNEAVKVIRVYRVNYKINILKQKIIYFHLLYFVYMFSWSFKTLKNRIKYDKLEKLFSSIVIIQNLIKFLVFIYKMLNVKLTCAATQKFVGIMNVDFPFCLCPIYVFL